VGNTPMFRAPLAGDHPQKRFALPHDAEARTV
jgi:hypothetical protein